MANFQDKRETREMRETRDERELKLTLTLPGDVRCGAAVAQSVNTPKLRLRFRLRLRLRFRFVLNVDVGVTCGAVWQG